MADEGQESDSIERKSLCEVKMPRVGAVEKGDIANDIRAEEVVRSKCPSFVVPPV